MTKPFFEDFQYKGVDNDTQIKRMVEARETALVETGFSSDTHGQKLATYMTTPETLLSDDIIVRTTAFSDDNGRESGAVFDALIAANTGRRVITANAPGIDYYSDLRGDHLQEMTPDQREALRTSGSYGKIGAAVFKAIDGMRAQLDLNGGYIFTGSSMGVAIMGGMIAASKESRVVGITIAEAVNVSDRSTLSLGAQFAAQSLSAPGYGAMNPAVLRELDEPPLQWINRMKFNTKPNYRYARAMAHGAFLADIGTPEHLETIPVYISRGAGSRLSPPDAPVKIAKHLKEIDAAVQTRVFGNADTNPHDHPYTLTVQSVIDSVNAVI